ncbi:MAG TPA: VWA domain-containing protein [Thermoanaerobaculia bacterium]|nr:VWA domain-containing protein [Thermoanaerobaculia bacterium]
MRTLLTVLLSLTIAGTALAADGDKPLTRAERKDRVSKLADKHRAFLADVEPIASTAETDTFLRLETEAQRDVFIEDFWRRRDIAAGTTGHAARDDYYERLEFVRTSFNQVMSDRGRVYLIHGVPAALIDVKCPRYFVPLQVWYYPQVAGLGRDVTLLFYQPRNERSYRLWSARIDGFQKLIGNDIESTGRMPDNIIMDCKDGEAIGAAVAYMRNNEDRVMMKVFTPPAVNEEDVNRILRSSVVTDPKAPKLEAEMKVAYPSSDGSKTDAQLVILVPRAQLKTTAVNDVSVYTIDVVGEVLRDGRMWERFRYRFDYPGEIQDEKLPIVIDRPLRPATYSLRVKLTDTSTNAQTILASEAVVPEMAATAPKPTEETNTLAAIREDMQSSRARLRIVPLTEDVISGLQTIQTLVSGSGIAGVEFYLDGKKVATRRTPPYKLDLDFGTMPRSRHVRVVAIDSHGATITGDEIVVNTGTDPFRVRIASPRVAPKLSGPTKVEMEVKVPEGKELNAIELYWNETRVATLYDPPFVQTVNIPGTDGVGYLRAVATLKDPEVDPVEDVVMVNTPEFMASVDVHLVELPTTVLVAGKPVNGLQETAFKVLDEGQPVKLAKFEHVKDLALSLGMAVDTSGSMEDRIAIARDAGAAFFKNVMRKGDKGFLVAFDSQPHIVQKWSQELKDIYSGLAKMRAEESTALYDAVVYSLYNFSGVKGQKALILLTDGRDTVSKFSFEQALEYAQRAAVPIYTVGINIHGMDVDVKSKLNRLATDTGGTSYYIENVTELSKIYTDIQNELRSQYVLGFYPNAEVKPGGKWREVTVQVAEGKVKTIRGYYP